MENIIKLDLNEVFGAPNPADYLRKIIEADMTPQDIEAEKRINTLIHELFFTGEEEQEEEQEQLGIDSLVI